MELTETQVVGCPLPLWSAKLTPLLSFNREKYNTIYVRLPSKAMNASTMVTAPEEVYIWRTR